MKHRVKLLKYKSQEKINRRTRSFNLKIKQSRSIFGQFVRNKFAQDIKTQYSEEKKRSLVYKFGCNLYLVKIYLLEKTLQ